jgi:hypothetical protein
MKPLPTKGIPAPQVFDELESLRADDVDWRNGKVFSLAYYAGPQAIAVAEDAYRRFSGENALSTDAFPSLRIMQQDVLSMVGPWLGAHKDSAGFMTSGGTESILMVVKAARDQFAQTRGVTTPNIVLPTSAHAAFEKACHYFGVESRRSAVGQDWRADIAAMERLIDDNTVMLVASANPEDYTNRGRIITPLKDRFGSQIRTHYPLEVETEIAIMRQESRAASIGDVTVTMPAFMERIIATFSHQARSSSHVNQRSGVSVRLSVSNFEILSANAVRRALRAGEKDVAPRVSDLDALASSTGGKVEIESLEEGRESLILQQLISAAVLTVYKELAPGSMMGEVITAFETGTIAHVGEDIPSAELIALFNDIPALRAPVLVLTEGDESPAVLASAVEFVLEGLHLTRRLNKDASGTKATYRSRG